MSIAVWNNFGPQAFSMTNVIGVVCLMDDILVYGKSQAQHDDRLVKVLCRLKVSGLTLNSDKCKFSQSKVRFLGHIVGAEGIHPDPHKIEAITQVKLRRMYAAS